MTSTDAPSLTLDHVVIAAEDLDEAEQEMTRVLGRRPSWKGRHPLYGTANILYRLDADGAYLELLAVDPEATGGGAWTEFLKGHLLERGPGIFSIAFQTPDVAATVTSLRARGLKADEPLPGEGVDLQTGARREWTNARVPPGETGGTACFFIQHRSPADALPIAPLIADADAIVQHVAGLTVETADMASATQLWHQRVGLTQATIEGGTAYHLGNAGLVVFSGVGEGAAPHRWVRLVLSRRGLTSLADRLDGAGVRFEQGEFREGYGIRVDVSGADVLITEG
jgi:catechol 2,3-dioxygenase-like lactoylglutathione lyase family enzyme